MKQKTAEGMTALLAGLMAFVMIFLFVEEAGATNKKDPDPVKMEQGQAQGQSTQVDVAATSEQSQTATADQTQSATSASDSLSTSASASGSSSDNAVAVNNVYMSRAFAQDFPITHGCFVGINAGGDKTAQTKSTGGFLGFTYLSNSCHVQALAAAEKDIDIVARLQCADRKYRKALAFDANDYGQSKRERCIDIKKQSLMGAIAEERRKLEERLKATENMLILEQTHKKVCDESLERCEDKVYGGK